MTVTTRVVALVLGLLVALAGGTTAGAATKSQRITITASPTRLQVGQKLDLSGTTKPAAKRKTVKIQEQRVGTDSWTTVTKVTTTSSGTYRATLTMADTADRYYRAYIPKRPGYRRAYSSRTPKIVVDAPTFAVTAGLTGPARVGVVSTVSGRVAPVVDASRLVYVQLRKVGASTWTTVSKTVVSSSGRYVGTFTPGSGQKVEVRVYKPGYGGRVAGYSPVVKVTVHPNRSDPSHPAPVRRQAVSLGIENVVNPQDWTGIRSHLDSVHANVVHVAAGRVEWTAFDWAAHPEAAAEPGADHIARVIEELGAMPDGGGRQFDLMIDALVPAWIAKDPSIAGRAVDGKRATYMASATAIHDGAVGNRFVELARDLAIRYKPAQITFSELMFDDETFGADDLALYKRMTGAKDWPRDRQGRIDQHSPKIGAWRSQVLYDLLARVRLALDAAQPKVGHRVDLAIDVLANWENPAAGRPDGGHDYRTLLAAADRIVLWAYFGTAGQEPARIERLTAALRASRLTASQYTVSVGLWNTGDGEEPEQSVITPQQLSTAVKAAATHDTVSINVTPLTLMTSAHWTALAQVWTTWPA